MKKVKEHIILLFVMSLLCLSAQSQSPFSVDFKVGYGFNPKLKTLNHEVENPHAAISSFDLNYRPKLFGNFRLHLGLGGRYIINYGKINDQKFRVATIRPAAKILANYELNERNNFGLGVQLQINRDIDDIETFQWQNYRYDLLAEWRYRLRGNLFFVLQANSALSRYSDKYLVIDPFFGVSAGLSIHFNQWKNGK
ncbi:MAG: hypothetical protein MI810_14970 [Flavobacteriales bacterium]|nr:hypothetical protein [Flavobacteriales bacterium]